MACIDIDVDDYLFEASDRAILAEFKRRLADGVPKFVEEDPFGPQPWTRGGMADDIRTAFYSRDASRMEMLLHALEEREIA